MRKHPTAMPSFLGRLGFLGTLLLAGPIFAQSITYNVRAFIDGSSVLIIQGNTISWHNLAFYAPGKWVDPSGPVHNDPTVITTTLNDVTAMNGYNWFPNWPTGVFGEQFSDPLVSLNPPLPSTNTDVTLKVVSARESLTAYQLPTPSNGYTLAILFSDFNTSGAAWYEVQINIKPPSAGLGLSDWNLAFTQPSVARLSMNMAFDSGRQVPVMFGGRDSFLTTVFSDTYEYALTAWNKVLTPHSPPARFWAGMAYDDHRQRTVVFGGLNSSSNTATSFNDTWEYDGSDWTSIPTAHSPVAQNALSMTYDSCRQKIVVFGAQSETWEYDGYDWTKVTTGTAPPERRLSAMVFDPGRCRAILFAGLPAVGPLNALSDTWEYDGVTWTQINTATSPSGRWGHVMAFDTNRARTTLFGGYGPIYPSGQETNDTWEYDGAAWMQVFPQHSPGAAEQRAMVYDPIRARAVTFGGFGNPGEAWEYRGSRSKSRGGK